MSLASSAHPPRPKPEERVREQPGPAIVQLVRSLLYTVLAVIALGIVYPVVGIALERSVSAQREAASFQSAIAEQSIKPAYFHGQLKISRTAASAQIGRVGAARKLSPGLR